MIMHSDMQPICSVFKCEEEMMQKMMKDKEDISLLVKDENKSCKRPFQIAPLNCAQGNGRIDAAHSVKLSFYHFYSFF